MAFYMVERELTGRCMAALTGSQGVLATAQGAGEASYLRSMFLPKMGRFFCLFEAPSIEAVRRANDAAGLPYKTILPASDLLYAV